METTEKKREKSKTAQRRADLGTRVRIDTLCVECDGEGHYHDPEWSAWSAAYSEAEEQAKLELGVKRDSWQPVIDRAEAIMRERGITQPTGPEEPPCAECEGDGRVVKFIKLEELAALLDQARGLCPGCGRGATPAPHICTGKGGQ